MAVVEIDLVQRRDAVEGTRRGGHQLRADTVPRETCNGLGHPPVLLRSCVGRAPSAHFSPSSVDVCGVQGRVSDISPLAGENENGNDDEHPERAEPHRGERHRELEGARRAGHGRTSVPTTWLAVKLQKEKLPLPDAATIVLEAMTGKRSSVIALGLILPR